MELEFAMYAWPNLERALGSFHPSQVVFFVCGDRSRSAIVHGCHISKAAADQERKSFGKSACVRIGTIKRGLRPADWRAVV
jgi:hypothetical protein